MPDYKKDLAYYSKLFPLRIRNFLTVVLIIVLLHVSLRCRKDKYKPPTSLPSVTQEGNNTFGCKINGEIWIPPPQKCDFGVNTCGMKFIVGKKMLLSSSTPLSFQIGLSRRINNSSDYLDIYTKDSTGVSFPGEKIDSFLFRYIKGSLIEYSNKYTSSNFNRLTILKIDTLNRILACTFNAVLYRSPNDSVVITDGRFDFKFQLLE